MNEANAIIALVNDDEEFHRGITGNNLEKMMIPGCSNEICRGVGLGSVER